MRPWTCARIATPIGLCGAGVMALSLAAASEPPVHSPLPVVAAFAGATAAGLLLAGWFGQGVPRAALGAVLATLLGAALGGAFLMLLDNPLAGLLAGPVWVAGSFFAAPSILVLWAGAMAAVELLARRLRRT